MARIGLTTKPPLARAYAVAVACCIAATLGTWLLTPYLRISIFALFLCGVTISAWYGGLGPGALTTLLSALVSNYLFIEPHNAFAITVEALSQVAVFLFVAFLISTLTEARHRSEAAARAEREYYAVTLTSIGDGVLVTDQTGRVTLMNAVAESLTGWQLADARGQPIETVFQIVNETTRATVENPIARVLRENQVVGLANHTVLIARDGAERPIDDSGAPVRNAAGQLIGCVLVFRDIGERREQERARDAALAAEQAARAEAQAAETRATFLARAGDVLNSSLEYEQTLDAVAHLAVPSIADLCVVFLLEPGGMIRRVTSAHIDPAAEAELRALQAALIDPAGEHPAAEVIRTRQALFNPPIPEAVLSAISADPERQTLLRALTPPSQMIVPLISRTITLGAISLGLGASERRYTEADLTLGHKLAQRAAGAIDNARLYGEAQAAIQARDMFLSLAAHELKNPLTAILGNIQLVERRLLRAAEPDQRLLRPSQVAHAQVRRLGHLIATLLDVSRIEAGQLTISCVPLDLCALTRQVLEAIEPTIIDHQLALELPAAPLRIMGDAGRLEQVLSNLLQNAVKYSPAGGTIGVRLARQGDRAALAVSDQGIGIEPEALPHLFEPFYRSADAARQSVTGMGIGLYVVREIMTLHGGSVTVESTLGQGSCFTIWLPLPASAGAEPGSAV